MPLWVKECANSACSSDTTLNTEYWILNNDELLVTGVQCKVYSSALHRGAYANIHGLVMEMLIFVIALQLCEKKKEKNLATLVLWWNSSWAHLKHVQSIRKPLRLDFIHIPRKENRFFNFLPCCFFTCQHPSCSGVDDVKSESQNVDEKVAFKCFYSNICSQENCHR